MYLALDALLRPGEGGRLPRHEQQGARHLSPMETKPAEWRKGGKLCKDRSEPFPRREKGEDLGKFDMIQFSKKVELVDSASDSPGCSSCQLQDSLLLHLEGTCEQSFLGIVPALIIVDFYILSFSDRQRLQDHQ